MQNEATPPTPKQAGLAARLLGLFFRLLYHSFAWAYDLVANTVSLGRWQTWVLATQRLLATTEIDPASPILELGFGPGHLQAHLRAAGRQVYGLDESPQMARMAHRRLNKQRAMPLLVRGLAQALPYPCASFDSVIATFPTLYIVHPTTLAEIRRVLSPNGQLIVLSAAWHIGQSLPERLMAFVFRITGESPSTEAIDEAGMTRPFQAAGFQARVEWVEVTGSRLLFIIANPHFNT